MYNMMGVFWNIPCYERKPLKSVGYVYISKLTVFFWIDAFSRNGVRVTMLAATRTQKMRFTQRRYIFYLLIW